MIKFSNDKMFSQKKQTASVDKKTQRSTPVNRSSIRKDLYRSCWEY